MTTAPGVPESGRIRLHITPFNLQLKDRIIAPSLQPKISNLSFHTVSTFPELGFGYVDLPIMEAEKLRKKLNGTTLRGSKIRIEEAKPEKRRRSQDPDGDDDVELSEKKLRKKARKGDRRRRGEGVIPGHELEKGRHVKRGWSDGDKESNDKSRSRRDKRSEQSDLVSSKGGDKSRRMKFRTSIPENVKMVDGKAKLKTPKPKASKGKREKERFVVEEFRRHKQTQDQPVGRRPPGEILYEDGKGWVDGNGNIVEPERLSKRYKVEPPEEVKNEPLKRSLEPLRDSKKGPETPRHAVQDTSQQKVEHTPSAPSSASDTEESDTDSSSSVSGESSGDSKKSPASETSIQLRKPIAITPDSEKEVHPLEALFKRAPPADSPKDSPSNKPRPAPIDTSFSFFNVDATETDGQDEQDVIPPPHTPHTKQDLEWRGLRSAAPTPDTAAIGKKFSFPFPGASDEEEQDAEDGPSDAEHMTEDADANASKSTRPQEESEFRKWFYENRGDLNRSWKKRRRDARKVVRQRENRRLTRKLGVS